MHAMRFAFRVSSMFLASVVLCFSQGRALAANLDTVADHVIGQTNFTSNLANQGGAVSATSLNQVFDVAIDRRNGQIWVADTSNNRVLHYSSAAALANGQAADFVLGQPNLTTGTVNTGGLSASSLSSPFGVALDGNGNVFVSDTGNNRVLLYRQPLTDAVADVVIGQANFTSAGSGTTQSTLSAPMRMALDRNGNLFVADFSNSRVLEFSPPFSNGMNASLVLGQADFVTGTANTGGISASSLSNPQGVAFDANYNLYVADVFNHRVLEYNAGFVTHAAATRVYGQAGSFATGTANNGGLSASSLNTPRGVSVDPFNNVFISDSNNSRVVEYDGISTAAAARVYGQSNFTTATPNTGGVSASSLNAPLNSAHDNSGNLFIADGSNFRVLEYDFPIMAGVPGTSSLFPSTMAAGSPGFTLYVNGSGFISSSTIQVNGTAIPTTFVNFTMLTGAVPAANAAAVGLDAVTVTTPAPGGGISSFLPLSIYDRNPNDTIADRVFGQPDFATGSANTGGISAHSMNAPYDLSIDTTGRLWVVEINNSRVLSWASADALTDGKDADFVLGQKDFISNTPGTSATAFAFPGGVLVDAAGNVYVADTGNARILIFNDPLHTDAIADVVLGQANFTTGLAHQGGAVAASGLNAPYGMALDASGNLYVVDYADSRVLRYSPPFVTNMNATLVFGQPNFISNAPNNGGVSAATLGGPGYAAVDSTGKLYISDFGNNRVLVYAPPFTNSMSATLVLGQPNFTTITANTGGVSAQSMSNPDGVALDPADNLYVTDRANSRILEFNAPLASNAAANRVFGQGGSFTSGTSNNGGRSAASLSLAVGLALDAKRNLYVCDYVNNRVLSYDHPIENLPVVSSVAVATPSTALIGQPVNFTAGATDADNDTLTYTWDFGDSTAGTGASVSHAYMVAGIVNVKVTIDDGVGGIVTSLLTVTVKAPNPLGDLKLGAKLNFAKPNSDSISASGTVELLPGNLTGKQAIVQVADLIETFTIAKTAKNADGSFSLSSKGTAARAAKFKLTLSKKTFAAALASAGLVNMTVSAQVHVPITITLDGTVYQATATLTYTGKLGVSGKTK